MVFAMTDSMKEQSCGQTFMRSVKAQQKAMIWLLKSPQLQVTAVQQPLILPAAFLSVRKMRIA